MVEERREDRDALRPHAGLRVREPLSRGVLDALPARTGLRDERAQALRCVPADPLVAAVPEQSADRIEGRVLLSEEHEPEQGVAHHLLVAVVESREERAQGLGVAREAERAGGDRPVRERPGFELLDELLPVLVREGAQVGLEQARLATLLGALRGEEQRVPRADLAVEIGEQLADGRRRVRRLDDLLDRFLAVSVVLVGGAGRGARRGDQRRREESAGESIEHGREGRAGASDLPARHPSRLVPGTAPDEMGIHVLDAMAREGFEEVVALHDSASNLRGFLGIHDSRVGPAFGGIRVWSYRDEDEALLDCLRSR